MIQWSPEKATMIGRSRMHFACINLENYFVYKLVISKISRNTLSSESGVRNLRITILFRLSKFPYLVIVLTQL